MSVVHRPVLYCQAGWMISDKNSGWHSSHPYCSKYSFIWRMANEYCGTGDSITTRVLQWIDPTALLPLHLRADNHDPAHMRCLLYRRIATPDHRRRLVGIDKLIVITSFHAIASGPSHCCRGSSSNGRRAPSSAKFHRTQHRLSLRCSLPSLVIQRRPHRAFTSQRNCHSIVGYLLGQDHGSIAQEADYAALSRLTLVKPDSQIIIRWDIMVSSEPLSAILSDSSVKFEC